MPLTCFYMFPLAEQGIAKKLFLAHVRLRQTRKVASVQQHLCRFGQRGMAHEPSRTPACGG
jgi:hypothetical protein